MSTSIPRLEYDLLDELFRADAPTRRFRQLPGCTLRSYVRYLNFWEGPPCGRVVITHLVQAPVTLSTISSPIVSFLPIHKFSIKSFSPDVNSTTMFGLNRLTSKRPSG